MALIACPECSRRISSDALTCPGCGSPTKLAIEQACFKNREAEYKHSFWVLLCGLAPVLLMLSGNVTMAVVASVGAIIQAIAAGATASQKGSCGCAAVALLLAIVPWVLLFIFGR